MAVHAERDGVIEGIVLARAHGEERLTEQSEVDADDGAGAAALLRARGYKVAEPS